MADSVSISDERHRIYRCLFSDLLHGCSTEEPDVELTCANLLIDTRWPEVSRALADTVCDLCAIDDFAIRPIAHDVARLVDRSATIAFGTCRHAAIPSWFLQNCECLLAATLHKMLVRFVSAAPVPEWTRRRAFRVLLDVAEGLRGFVGLRCVGESTGAHALMSAVSNSRYDFLAKEAAIIHPTERIFVNVLAEKILDDPNRAMEARSAFCFFARSERWRTFASACLDREGLLGPLAQLLAEVVLATERVSVVASASPKRVARVHLKAQTPTKPPRSRIAKPASHAAKQRLQSTR